MKRIPVDKLLLGLLYISIAVAIVVAAMLAVPVKNNSKTKIVLGDQEVFVMVADTAALREQGLSGRESLNEGEGMFFVFPELGKHGFWMKDMRFPIDIIWFDQKYQIIDVWEYADPSSYPKVVVPHEDAQYVLEVPEGFFAKHQLKIGNILKIIR